MLDLPVIGERITTDHSDAIFGRLNRSLPLIVAADESTNSGSGSASDVTGMTFAVENGTAYRIEGQVWYSCSATNQGIGFGFQHPGGDAIGLFRVTGPSGTTTETIERIREQSATTDEMLTAATVGSGGTIYVVEFSVVYTCTADGTFKFRKQRNGTSGSTGVTIYAGSGALVHLLA